MKLLYMLKKQYSRFFLREIVVVAQIVLMVLLFTPIFSQLDRLLAVDQLSKNIRNPTYFFQADSYFFMPEFLDPQEYRDFFDEIEACDAVKEVGLTSYGGCNIREGGVSVYFYNDGLFSNLKLEAEHFEDEEGVIPVILNYELGKIYDVGDIITPESTMLFPVSAERLPVLFKVVGVLNDKSDYYYSLTGGASNITLESIGHRDEALCMIAVGAFNIVPEVDIHPSSLLFVDKEDSEILDKINESIGHLGHAEGLKVMRQNSLNFILTENPLPFISAVLMVLLCIAGVCSYAYVSVIRLRENFAIYYICGLRRNAAMAVAMYSLLLLLAISLLASLFFLSVFVDGSQYNGLKYSIYIVVSLFVLSFAIVLSQYGSINPIKLMRKGD